MKKGLLILGGIGILSLIVYLSFYYIPDHNQTQRKLNEVLRNFNSDEWQKRDEALGDILRDEELLRDEKVHQSLLQVLVQETAFFKELKRKFELGEDVSSEEGEARGEYHINLLDTVSKLKDPAAIPLFVESLEFGPGTAKALAVFGDQAIPPLIEKCEKGDEYERRGCLDTLFLFYRQTSSEKFKAEIKAAMNKATQDSSDWVKRNAMQILKQME